MGKFNLDEVRADVMQNGGGTYTADGDAVALSRGFVVSLDHAGIIARSINHVSGAMLRVMARRARKYGGFVGIWQDEKTGLVYLDVSQVFADKERALMFARANNQLAIFDASTGESIYLA